MTPYAVCPSYGRAGRVKVRSWWPDVTLAVVESQADAYRAAEGGSLLVLPDSVAGNIATTRNAILDRLHPDHEWVVTVDDDLAYVGRFTRGQSNPIDAEHLDFLLTQGCVLADDAGAFLWGVNVQADPKFYREYSPFSFVSPVLGPFTVHRRGSGCRYDERLPLKEDYDYWLQQIQRHHRTFRLNMYHYMANHFTEPGGVTSYRNMDAEKAQLELLQRKWGRGVVQFNLARSVNPKMNVPVPGI